MWRAIRLYAILAALTSGLSVAWSSPPTLADFEMLADVRAVDLSPSGQKLLIVRAGSAHDEYLVEIRNTNSLEASGTVFGAAPAEIRNARWITDETILVELGQRVTTAKGGLWGSFNAIIDASGRLKWKLPSQNAEILALRTTTPGEMILAYNSGGGRGRDLHRYNALTGKSERILRGDDRRFGYIVDRTGEPRVSAIFNPDSFDIQYFARSRGSGAWRAIVKVSALDRRAFEPLGFYTDNPDELVVVANRSGDRAGLYAYNVETASYVRTLYENPTVDVDGAATSSDGRLIGARYILDRPYVAYFDGEAAALSTRLSKALPGRTAMIGLPTPSGFRLVRTTGAHDPGSFYLADNGGNLRRLAPSQPQMDGKDLADVALTAFTARDGVVIPAYVTKQGNTSLPAPLVVLPHGGPWSRDSGGYDEWSQMLAARGYVVVQPQFRGSKGFGRTFWMAGDREWGGKMQDDLDDAVRYLVKQGVADPKHVAMFGWSYGGYAALVAATRPAGLYRCAISGAGVSNLDKISAGLAESFALRRIQRPTIAGVSPVTKLDQATIPVFLVHGDIDETVDVSHSREAANILKRAGLPYQYLEVQGLDHIRDRFTFAHRKAVYGAITGWLDDNCGMKRAAD